MRKPSLILNEYNNTLNYHGEEINEIVICEDNKLMASCDDNGQIKIFDIESKKLQKTLNKHTNVKKSISNFYQTYFKKF